MSDLELSRNQRVLRAPPGAYRVIQTTGWKLPESEQQHTLVDDYRDRHVAFAVRNALLRVNDEQGDRVTYTIRNEEGREVGILGICITEEERRAPPGKIRVVCIDLAPIRIGMPHSVWLQADVSNLEEAAQWVKTDHGPGTGMQAHDEHGKALFA